MKRNSLVIISVTFGLVGCSSLYAPKLQDVNKSKAQMEIAFEYGGISWPGVDWSEAEQIAKEQCAKWGFLKIKEIGFQSTECLDSQQGGGCSTQRIIQRYQCY